MSNKIKGTMKAEFKTYLNRFYEEYGTVPRGFTSANSRSNTETEVTGKDPEDYPTFKEFLDF
ncbi:hypothetical protein [Staphylococcus aureus]|uniref:hypothetical protein n=1 Tax=Staphylococcus aureus TaxID=1280 RepID=UPI001F4FBE3D|nr:hypothetical protein [Staphylococcus aureus]